MLHGRTGTPLKGLEPLEDPCRSRCSLKRTAAHGGPMSEHGEKSEKEGAAQRNRFVPGTQSCPTPPAPSFVPPLASLKGPSITCSNNKGAEGSLE